MSVAELAPRDEFERTPPHDIAAEQCVLGGMLLSKDAISDVLEVIRPADHYRPAHQVVHETILDMYGKGEPADAITVAAELTKRGDIGKVGGAPYLHTLIASVPTAANAGYYARIVRERAILRRLVEVGTRIVQLGYAGDADADELVDRAQAEVYGVTERRVSDDYLPLSEIMPGALVEIEAIGSRSGGLTGVPTGFADLDALTNGLHPGQMIVIAARPALGKALALRTPLPTPAGWTTMGEVRVGDLLLGAGGRPVRVVAATPVMCGRPCYQVEFSDGEVIVADGQHLWSTWSRAARWQAARNRCRPAGRERPLPQLLTTAEIGASLRLARGGARSNHAVPLAAPLDLPGRPLPVPPYALGARLAAARQPRGCADRAGADAPGPEVALRLAEAGDHAAGRESAAPVVEDNDRIPAEYLRAGNEQRRALLAGLLDVVGRVTGSGTIEVAVASERLAADIRELALGLGYHCTLGQAGQDGADGQVGAVGAVGPPGADGLTHVRFRADDQVFGISTKQRLHKERQAAGPRPVRWRYIVAVRQVPSRPVRCVQVDSADRLYLAGQAMIPTHNSTLALDLARAASIRHGLASVIFSLEMSRNEITMRLLSAEARVALHSMRTGQMGDEDWTRLARRMSEVAHAPMYIDDSPNLSMMEIRAKCRRLKQRHELRLVIIDYLQLMTSPKRVENRQQEVSDMSRSLKLLAKELDVPVIAVAQLNRGPEQRTDKRPMLSDLRESGCLTSDTTLLRADNGAPITLHELIAGGHGDVLVWSLDAKHRIVAAPVTNVFSAGVKEVYRLRLASGREVKASANHPFLAISGWSALEDLAAGDRIAIPRRIPTPIGAGLGWSEQRLGLLAHLIGDGCVLPRQPVHYTSNDEAKELGIDDLRSQAKRIPALLYAASEEEVATFLRHLWATDGCVAVPRGGTAPKIYYASSSRELADGVATLLARLGIVARIGQVRKAGYRPGFHVIIADGPSLHEFCTRIGVPGRGGLAVADIATSDVYWDRVESIEPLGPQPVFDATVKGSHNFIADGIFAHNSIEQDADVVILLHREDAYERESPRAGEADFIVAKHRNGPTATVTVAFQGHYSRFVDMARI